MADEWGNDYAPEDFCRCGEPLSRHDAIPGGECQTCRAQALADADHD